MKRDDLFCCPACASMFRPIRNEEICPKCEADERHRLDEIENEINAAAYRERNQ